MPRTSTAERLWPVLALVVLCLTTAAQARQFRAVRPIATPVAAASALPDGARAVDEVVALSREQVEPAVQRVIESWNRGTLDSQLARGFYDRMRLLDAVDTVAPRNATLRLQSVQGVQTLQQYIEPDPQAPGAERLVTRVSVTARTQLEFVEPGGDFVRRPGTNEFVLSIIHPDQGP